MQTQTLTKLAVVSDEQHVSLHFTDPDDSKWYICQVSPRNVAWLIDSLERALEKLPAESKI